MLPKRRAHWGNEVRSKTRQECIVAKPEKHLSLLKLEVNSTLWPLFHTLALGQIYLPVLLCNVITPLFNVLHFPLSLISSNERQEPRLLLCPCQSRCVNRSPPACQDCGRWIPSRTAVSSWLAPVLTAVKTPVGRMDSNAPRSSGLQSSFSNSCTSQRWAAPQEKVS